MTRSDSTEQKYAKYRDTLKADECQFCTVPKRQIVESSKELLVIQNIFPYELWDSCEVLDHLMIVPRRHIVSKSDYSQVEREQFMDVICDYEKNGYSLYSRGHNSIMKSVLHQHSHLIKLDNSARVSHLFFNQEPYVQIYSTVEGSR